MSLLPRAARRLALLLPAALVAQTPLLARDAPAQTAAPQAQPQAVAPAPKYLQTGDTTPWIYRGSDVPQDKEWLFGQMPNGVQPSPSRLSAAAQTPPRPMVQGMSKSPKKRRPAPASTRMALTTDALSGPAWWRDSAHYADWKAG